MHRYAIWCPACGEVGVTEQPPAGDGAVACLYCGGGAKWWPIDEVGDVTDAGAGAPPAFVRVTIRQLLSAM